MAAASWAVESPMVLDVCKTVQETLHFRTPMHEWRTSDQLEHLEEMETASRAVFERHKKRIRDEELKSRDEHATHMCTLARQLNAVLDAEQNTIDAFQCRRKKLKLGDESGVQNNPIYVSLYI